MNHYEEKRQWEAISSGQLDTIQAFVKDFPERLNEVRTSRRALDGGGRRGDLTFGDEFRQCVTDPSNLSLPSFP
jgi:hypothetical protein